MKQHFENSFLEKLELRLDAIEAGLVDGEIFEKRVQLLLAFAAGEQAVVAVKRIEIAGFEAALQAIAEKMSAALIEIHATFLIDERLQQLELCIGKRNLSGQCGHVCSLCVLTVCFVAGFVPFLLPGLCCQTQARTRTPLLSRRDCFAFL